MKSKSKIRNKKTLKKEYIYVFLIVLLFSLLLIFSFKFNKSDKSESEYENTNWCPIQKMQVGDVLSVIYGVKECPERPKDKCCHQFVRRIEESGVENMSVVWDNEDFSYISVLSYVDGKFSTKTITDKKAERIRYYDEKDNLILVTYLNESVVEKTIKKGLIPGALISMLPFVELRLGLPIAIVYNKPWLAFVFCVAANIIIIPFIFLFLDYAHFRLLRIKTYSKISDRILNKMRPRSVKVKEKMAIYGFPALMLFVSIPLPVTGAYAGSIIAWLLNLERKKSFLAIAAGVTIAGIIITLISLGIINIFNLG